MNGTDILLLMNIGTAESPSYEVLGSQRNAAITENTAARDASSKDSRAAKNEPGRYSATISLDALYVPTEDGYQALLDAMRDGTKLLVRKQEEDVAIEEATCVVTSMSQAAPDQETATIAIELTLDGEFTELTS